MAALAAAAEELARRLHDGQLDRSGRPLVEHIARVAAAARLRVPADDVAEAAAWLTPPLKMHCLLSEIAERFPEQVVAAVDALTHRSQNGCLTAAEMQ